MAEIEYTDVPRQLKEMYEKGRAALAKSNFDYAITLFDQVLRKAPGFYACREALRATQFTKAQKGTSFFKKFLGSANPLLAKAQVQLRTNPLDAINTAEQILNKDPHSTSAHKLLADAALLAGFPKTAVLSLEIVFKNKQDDRENALKLAKALRTVGRTQKGEQILLALREVFPNDGEINSALKDFTARVTLEEGGYDKLSDGKGSYRDILKDKDEAVSLEQENREVKTADVADRLIQDYEAKLAGEPDNLKLARSLGDLYTQKGDFDRALEYYDRITQSQGGNEPTHQRIIAATQLKKFDHQLSQLDPTEPDYESRKGELEKSRTTFQLQECEQRCRQFPNDLEIKFELGKLLFEAAQYTQAIKELQKAQSHPHWRIPAMKYLGKCFARRGISDLAARTFQNAIQAKEVFDDEKKDLLYELGSAYEKMGKAEEAIEQFKQVYEVDIDYLDVADKIDAYYSGS